MGSIKLKTGLVLSIKDNEWCKGVRRGLYLQVIGHIINIMCIFVIILTQTNEARHTFLQIEGLILF